jgi:hypothetical protein
MAWMALVEGFPVSSEGYGWYLPEDQTPVTKQPAILLVLTAVLLVICLYD